MDRSNISEKTFSDARELAQENGMKLTNPSDGCYQLRYAAMNWIINIYPRRAGASPRMYHDRNHPGPFLQLPDNWTIMDAVRAAVDAAKSETRG